MKSTDDIEGFIRIDSGWRDSQNSDIPNAGPLLICRQQIEALNYDGKRLYIMLASGRMYWADGDAATQVLAQIAR